MIRKIFLILFVILLPTVSYADITLNPDLIVKNINAERAKAGLSVLMENNALSSAAHIKAREIATKQALIHSTGMPWSALSQAGYSYQYAGENLAVNSWPESQLVKDWMDSASHRRNILNPEFQDVGIGVIQGTYMGQDTVYAVAYFAVQKSPSVVFGATTQSNNSETINEKRIVIIRQLIMLLTEYLRIINETRI